MLALVMVRVATTLLTPEEMGKSSLVLTTIAFFALFLVNPVGMFINRRLHAWQASGVAKYYLLRYTLYLIFVVLIAAFILPLIYMSGIVNFGIPVAWLTILVCGSLFFNTINQTAIPSLNLLGDSRKFVLLSIATLSASVASAALLVLTVQANAQYWLLGLLIGQALFALVGTRVLFIRLENNGIPSASPAINRRHLQLLFSFAWPVVIAAGLSWVQGQGYRYLMEGQLGMAQLGLFVAGYGISAGIIAGFESVVATYFQPRLYRDVNINNPLERTRAWQRYAVALIPSLILTVALVVMLAPELTHLFLGVNFQSSANFVVWGALAEATRVIVGVYSLIAHVHMQTRWLILPNVIGALLSIALCIELIPILGPAGAGMGLVMSGVAMVITMHILMAKHVERGIPMRPVVKSGMLAAILWGLTLLLRQLQDGTLLGDIGFTLIPIGFFYLGLQYLLLRQLLREKR